MRGYHMIGLDLYNENWDQWVEGVVAATMDEFGHLLRLRSEFEQYLAERGDVE